MSDAPQGPGWWQASDGRWYPPESAPSPVAPAGSPPGAYPPQGYPAATVTSTNGRSVTSLVLGLASVFACGFFTGIPAIIVGRRARKEIAASAGSEEGEGLATAGVVLGIIGTALSALGVLLLGAFLLFAILAGSSEVDMRFDDVGVPVEEINSDPPDGYCDYDRFMQDPDC